MAIEQDIYDLKRIAALFGTSKIAEALAAEWIADMRQKKQEKGPQDDTSTLSKGIFAQSPPLGGQAIWEVGVGYGGILGTPDKKAPEHTIRDFLDFIRGTYAAKQERKARTAAETTSTRARQVSELATRAAENARLKAQRQELRAENIALGPYRRRLATAQAKLSALRERLTNFNRERSREVAGITRSLKSVEKELQEFLRIYKTEIPGVEEQIAHIRRTRAELRFPPLSEREETVTRLKEFLKSYNAVVAKGTKIVVGYRVVSKLGQMEQHIPIYRKDTKRIKAASKLRKRIVTVLRKNNAVLRARDILESKIDRMLEDVIPSLETELEKKRKKFSSQR